MSENKTETYPVSGMSCAGCEIIIENTIGALAGVRQTNANVADRTVTITYDPAQIDFEKCGWLCKKKDILWKNRFLEKQQRKKNRCR